MTTTAIGQATGSISAPDDSDWFKVSLTAGTQYVFTVTGGTLGAGNSVLALYDSLGNQITSGSMINTEPTSSGTYFVGIKGLSGSTGTYSILESTAPYDYAGNTSTTGVLNVGSSVSGTLANPGQNDWFKVSLTAGTTYSFSMSSGSSSGLVTLYNSAGKYVVSGDDGNTLSGTNITFTPTASGTYFLGASDNQLATGTFTLTAGTATVDFLGNVNTTGTLSIGGTATGNITNVGQSDWFKVTLTAGQEYVFNLAGSGGLTPAVSVYDSSGNSLASGFKGGANGGAAVSFEPTATGTYYIGAAGILSSLGGFTLSAATATPDYLGTTATTGTITVGGTANGNITTTGQSDWFKVSLTAGNAYLMNVSGALGGPAVSVYDSNGNQLVTGSSGGANGGAATLFEPTATGTYYIGASGSGTGAFTMSVAAATVDHLGTTGTTVAITPGGATGSGNLSYAGQSDWFRVNLTPGNQYTFTVGGGTLTSPIASLYDSSGKLLQMSDDGGQNSTTTSYTVSTGGTYYIGASSSAGALGSFTLSIGVAADDHGSGTSTTGIFYPVLNAAVAISESTAHTLAANSVITDSAGNIQSNLDALASVVASGNVSGITLTDGGTPTITVTPTQIAADAAVLQDITSSYTLAVTGYSSIMSQFVQGQHDRYIPGVNHAGSNQAVEIGGVAAAGAPTMSLGNGFNAVVIDGIHSTTASTGGQPDSFSFNVDVNGVVNLLDNNTGFSQTITGADYLIFNGGGQNVDSSYQSIVFVGGSTFGQLVSLYNAAFLRQPDLIGLEYYAAPLAAGSESLHQIATNFIASPEFQNDYPAAALSADHGGPHDQAFITLLYNNVLNRTPADFELSYYVNALASGSLDRAQMLIDFSLSPENQTNISNLLVNTTNGAYADTTDLLSATTVLSEVSSGATLNTAAIDPNSVGSGITVNGTTAATGSITVGATAPAENVVASASFSTITIQNSGSSVVDSSTVGTINLNGASNTTLTLGHNTGEQVNLLGGTNTTIIGFSVGSGINLNIANSLNPDTIQILDGRTAQVAGASLNFTNGTSYVVMIGTVSSDTASAIATAANKAYLVSGAASNNESITFLAQDASGDTLVWFWGSTKGASNGAIPASSLLPGADANGNHLVDANELTNVATILGVAPTTITVNDLA